MIFRHRQQHLRQIFQYQQLHSILIILYETNGDKYTGQWDGNYKGQGEINYKDGTKYTGQWDRDYRGKDYDSKRHGVGTLYTEDGQVLNQGKWEYNEYKGEQ